MSQIVKNNGNGHHGQQLQTLAASARSEAGGNPSGIKENFVTFQTADGLELRGALARLTRHAVFFELHNPDMVPRFSEALDEFKIVFQERTIYSGHAVVRNLVNMGSTVVCETTLNEVHWRDVDLGSVLNRDGALAQEFKAFINEWQKLYTILPEYKVVLTDMQTFLSDLRTWLEQIEIGIRAAPAGDRIKLENETAKKLEPEITATINSLFEKFEEVSNRVDEDLVPVHHAFGKRLLHPLLLSSPFVHRTFYKPLGYPGDYEMVNMMLRDPFEGGSLLAKMINAYALRLPPIVAHRNRITYLSERLSKESLRVMVRGGTARVFNLGCGPAHEVQRFLAKDEVANFTHFTLADFNEETLRHTTKVLDNLKQQHACRATLQLQRKTVNQLIKAADRKVEYFHGDLYDLVYCAGLFDYLSDQTCQKLMEIFYDMLAPDGLLIVTNVDDHSARNEMECFLEWHLVHRDEKRMKAIVPPSILSQDISLKRDPTGVNLFMEIRKPAREQ